MNANRTDFLNYGVRLVLAVTAEELASIGAEYLTIGWKSPTPSCRQTGARSEERRVGKEC